MTFSQLAGHLGADPEERRTPNGKKVTTLRVATRVWAEGKEETLWWSVSVWGDQFDNIIKHLKKGSAVWILGTMRKPRIWNDREGKPQVSLDINAQIVAFSPYGKSDRPEGGGGGYSDAAGMAGYQQPQRGGSQPPSYSMAGAPMGEGDFGGAPFSPHRYDAPHGDPNDEEMPF